MREIDQVEFAKRLAPLLSERKFLARGLLRGMLAARFQPKTPLIWGGEQMRYPLWWGAAIFASVILPGIAAAWFNSQGRPLPGGGLNLVFPAAAIIGWPAVTFLARRSGIKHKTRMENIAFGKGMRDAAPAAPESFALLFRSALAAAYSIPQELVGYADTARQIKSFSLMNEPLAVELIADIWAKQGVTLELERIGSAAEYFRAHRPSTVLELMIALHQEMRSALNQ